MSVLEQPLEYRRLAAPRENRGLLLDPPATDISEHIRRNISLREQTSADVDLHGRTLEELSRTLRRQFISAAIEYTRSYRDVDAVTLETAASSSAGDAPVLLAGHQPDLFHPGVWCKNFALSRLAEKNGATAINLLIDSDAVKKTRVRTPGGTLESPTLTPVAFDDLPPANVAYEEYSIANRELFDSFAPRVCEAISALVPSPLVETFWPRAIERANANGLLGLSLAQSRHQLEGEWGAKTLELPQSTVCQLEGFHYFTAHLLANLPRFFEVYNEAVHEYRRVNHIRSAAHPVPDLHTEDSYLEAPFWIWDAEDRERRRLFVRDEGEELRLTDRRHIDIRIAASPDGELDLATEQLAALTCRGIKIRTRALATTMFARLLLGDLFIHGIGGAKYDTLTDALLRRFFGLEPPEFVAASATLHLPVEHPQRSSNTTARVQQQLRNLVYHPETALKESEIAVDPQLREQAELKRRWVETVQTIENGKTRCRAIRSANEAMQPYVEGLRLELLAEGEQILAGIRSERILSSREYEFCLFPAEQLQAFLLDYLPARL